ncbi:CBASS cGAMP synthase [Tenacibaculum holothuriorum]|uniref:CBASS cGAMP synthase n=1 Tax=Tenacibaculum holothuriorum TaxID=1635173 RepID=UPI000A32310B|nr:hypothetical protein [Tenacibaculum holothuriorum]
MANCNNLFREFNRTIRLDNDRRIKLKEKRNDLRKRINGGFDIIKTNDNLNHRLEFQSQGSYVMDTIINPCNEEDQYDIDDGIYFLGELSREQRPEPSVFHDWIIKSIKSGKSDNDFEEIIDKDTCVRVVYKGDNGDLNYHVDLPSYYAIIVDEPDLADKKMWWQISSPIEFIIWFEKKINSGFKKEFIVESKLYSDQYSNWLNDMRKKDHQLRRIVRYLKAWGDFLKGDMPPGIVMTILAGVNYEEDDRDDISLEKTLKNIADYLVKNDFKCIRPTTPIGEDLFEKYKPQQKEYFKNALNSFIESAMQAIEMENQKSACRKWQKHLGDRFPCFLAKDEIEDSKTYTSAPLIKSDNSRSA